MEATVTLLLLSLQVLASTPAEAIDTTLDNFTQGAAQHDLDRVRAALHPEARQFVHMPAGLQVISTSDYLGLLEAKKLGGAPTTRTTDALHIDGRRATATQRRDIGDMTLHDTISLVEDGGQWQIVSVSVEVGG